MVQGACTPSGSHSAAMAGPGNGALSAAPGFRCQTLGDGGGPVAHGDNEVLVQAANFFSKAACDKTPLTVSKPVREMENVIRPYVDIYRCERSFY